MAKTEAEKAAAKTAAAERRKATAAAKKEAAEAETTRTGVSQFDSEPDSIKPSIEISAPAAMHTLLTITGRNFPPRADVKVKLSGSRTPSGLSWLRADPFGTVQLSIMPDPGKQKVSLEAEGAKAALDFEVAASSPA